MGGEGLPAHLWELLGGCFPSLPVQGFVLLLLLLEVAPGFPGFPVLLD